MPETRKKVVKTELGPSDYETLPNLAGRKNLAIKEAAREALRLWSTSATDLTKDPLFGLKPVGFKVKVRSDETEAFLYGRGWALFFVGSSALEAGMLPRQGDRTDAQDGCQVHRSHVVHDGRSCP